VKYTQIIPETMSDNKLNETTNVEDEDVMYVVTRTGRREPLDTNQITKRLQTLLHRPPKIQHVNPYELMLEVCKGLRSGITTYEIDEYTANASASLGITNPYYLKIAARVSIDNHQKNTQRSFVDKMRKLYLNYHNGKIDQRIASDYFKYVEEHQDFIENTIDYNRDFDLDFFGFQTFKRIYALRIGDTIIERPQDMFMRTAIDLHMKTCSDIKEEYANIRETYDLLSTKFYTHASPTYFNAGGLRRQYASCFLLGTEDSLEGIMKTASDISKISKWAGGIGVHVNCLRGSGSLIKGTHGQSSGLVPWLKIYNEVLRGFNQGGRRPGSAAFYLMPHHPDIMKFIEVVRNDGHEKQRARDIYIALWVPDIFMERVLNNQMWSTFEPVDCGDLSNYTGEEYTKRYLELEEKKMYKSQIPARKIWEAALETNKDVGRIYICFADNANKQFMQKNLGVLKSSNLCSEVYLYSDEHEYAVCILSSISLPNFVLDGYSKEELELPESERRVLNHEFPLNPYVDYEKLIHVTRVVTRNLNLIVDKTYHPLMETKRGNDRNRPIGIGVQGLDDCYAKMRYPFASNEAADLNKKIFETIYFASLTESSVLARQIYKQMRAECKATGHVNFIEHHPKHYKTSLRSFGSLNDIPTTIGSYPSMLWNGGSPISKGIFHWELAGLTPDKLSGMFDWENLREHIKTFGVRNSVTVACMPTASTSQLLGNNECIEPYTSNIYKRNTLAGEYIVVKKHLMEDLYKLNIWNNSMKEYLLASGGSIRHIDGIPDELKELYPTVWEIDQKKLIQQSIDRQPFIDQGQSLNLYVENINTKTWTQLMFMAWRGGLKTGKYYLHSKPTVTPQKFTIDPAKQNEMRAILEKNKHGTAFLEPLHDICEVCSG
jgi:ribonucleoside-diphosphate reductase alpha chain